MARYAKRQTKEDLMKGGIVKITEDCKIFGQNGELSVQQSNNQGYITVTLYDFDENGNKIKVPVKRTFKGCKKPSDTYVYKTRVNGLHRVMWAWFHNEVPEGMVVDHINNKHINIEDYHLDNLQLLTPQENVTKERICNIKEIPCKLDRPRSYYEEKLAKYEALYQEAKENRDKTEAHKQRTNIANIKGKLRYWDSNRKEAETLVAKKKEYTEEETARIEAKKQSIKDRKLLEQYKQMFKEAGNKGLWHQMCKVIKMWDSLEQFQKDHVFDTLHNFFSKYGRTL